jgi:hypothetical protein
MIFSGAPDSAPDYPVCTGLSGAPFARWARLAQGKASLEQKNPRAPVSEVNYSGAPNSAPDCPVCHQSNGYLSELAVGNDRWRTGGAPDRCARAQ